MENYLKGKVAVVTGGSFGIGRAAVMAFARHGARVVVADLVKGEEERPDLSDSAEWLIHFIHCDVSDSDSVKAMMDEVVAKYERIDIAFNNAGIEGESGRTHECTEENWDKTMGINLKGVWLCMKHEISQMLAQGGGVIVNCSSIAGLKGFTGLPAYVSSKHAIIGLTKTAALEYAKDGIRVNAVCPGVIHTAMIDRLTKNDTDVEKLYIAMEPVGRMGTPGEVAEAVLWLCSDAASFVTGIALPVDGGIMA